MIPLGQALVAYLVPETGREIKLCGDYFVSIQVFDMKCGCAGYLKLGLIGIHHPIITVGHPTLIVPPCAVLSPILAAGMPAIRTVVEPMAIVSGGPTQVHTSPTLAAGIPPIRTVGAPITIGPPTCGTPGGVTCGQTCMSDILAAGGIGKIRFLI